MFLFIFVLVEMKVKKSLVTEHDIERKTRKYVKVSLKYFINVIVIYQKEYYTILKIKTEKQ